MHSIRIRFSLWLAALQGLALLAGGVSGAAPAVSLTPKDRAILRAVMVHYLDQRNRAPSEGYADARLGDSLLEAWGGLGTRFLIVPNRAPNGKYDGTVMVYLAAKKLYERGQINAAALLVTVNREASWEAYVASDIAIEVNAALYSRSTLSPSLERRMRKVQREGESIRGAVTSLRCEALLRAS